MSLFKRKCKHKDPQVLRLSVNPIFRPFWPGYSYGPTYGVFRLCECGDQSLISPEYSLEEVAVDFLLHLGKRIEASKPGHKIKISYPNKDTQSHFSEMD